MRSAVRNRHANLQALARRRRDTSDKEVLSIALKLWSELDTPLSLGLSLLLKNGQIEDALRIEIPPGRYLDNEAHRYADDVQAVAFLRKMPLGIAGINREAAAWTKFAECEEMCRQTNARFRSLREGGSCPPAVHSILHGAQWKISRWLSDLDAKSWALRCRFGPGADNLTRSSRVSAYHKLSQLSSTEDFAEGAAALAASHPSWLRALRAKQQPGTDDANIYVDLDIVAGNKIVFVPKSALVDRSIAIEPRMNIYAQLGLGALLRQRLKKHAGLDLDDQVPSRELARVGSLTGAVATVDLSSASDTLARELVRELLPEPWYHAMDWCRSKVGLYQPKDEDLVLVEYEKFSSMGNGFTFELESMIFYALALSCAEYSRDDCALVRSYGDDIAYPTSSVELLEEVLKFCGFSVNLQKSFTTGVFRESCGADYFNGKNVRPYYQKEPLTYVEALYRLANGVRRVAVRRNRYYGCDLRLHGFWTYVVRRLPESLRALRGPFRRTGEHPGAVDVTSDDHYLACNIDEAMTSPHVRRNLDVQGGWLFTGLVPTGRHIRADERCEADLVAYALYSCRGELSDHALAGVAEHDDAHYRNRKVIGTSVSVHGSDRDGTLLLPLRGNGPRRLISSLSTDEFYDVGPWI